MTEINSEEFIAISKMQPEERFDYALAKMVELDHLWGLFGDNGWLLLKADDDACMPVWPHAEFAQAWEKDDFPDCKPKQIDFDAWKNQWLPGMQSNSTLVLVFPMSEDEEGIVIEAKEMLECIEEELQESKG